MSVTTEPFVETTAPARPVRAAAASRPQLQIEAELLTPDAWDAAIADFDGVCQETTYAFAARRWPGVALEPVLFRVHGEPVAGALMMIQRLPFGLGALAVSKWGPVLAHEDRADAGAVYEAVVDSLCASYAGERRMMLSILPRASRTDPNPWFAHLLDRGFKRDAELLFPNRYIVNLRLSDDAQRKSLAQKWRYHLNKSEKEGLAFERAGAERLGEFDALYQAMTDRKRFPDHSAYDTVHHLFETDETALRPELFFVRHEGEIVAGAIIFKAGKTAVYLYGATNDRALGLRAGYFMHWHIIRWLRDNTRADWYDLGGTDGFQGLHQFKKGMVGTAGIISPVPPIANHAAQWLPRLAGTAAYRARDAVQKVRQIVERLRGGMAKPDQER